MPLSAIIFYLKAIQEMKLYLRTVFGDSKVSYYGTMLQNFQGICQGNGGESSGWFIIVLILIIYLKDN